MLRLYKKCKINQRLSITKTLSVLALNLTSQWVYSSSPDIQSTYALFSSNLKKLHAQATVQLGGFIAAEGHDQHVDINGLFGNDYSVNHQTQSNGLVGASYFVQGHDTRYASFLYGVNAFYLPHVFVKGIVTQEQLFPNLTYQYAVTNWPIYIGAKALLKTPHHDKRDITLDVGIGPNIIHTSQYQEASNASSSQANLSFSSEPDFAFSSKTSASFAAQAGIGLRFNNTRLGSKAHLECGYRFFYLGQGSLKVRNNQFLNGLNTGYAYANALLCGVSV